MSKNIFNSLGVHYGIDTAISLLSDWITLDSVNNQTLASALALQYTGAVTLTYKGRDAIELAVRSLGLSVGDGVITQAFACGAIEEAIARTGAHAVYADLDEKTNTISSATLEKAYKKDARVRAVILQHTLGVPINMEEVVAWCRENNLLIIEDMAQVLGAEVRVSSDSAAKALGTFGHCTVFSFGRDKIIDAVTGGAVVIRDSEAQLKLAQYVDDHPLLPPNFWVEARDSFYPLFCVLIRNSYGILLGKILHRLMKMLRIMVSPTNSDSSRANAMQPQFAQLAVQRLSQLASQVELRTTKALLYDQRLKDHALDLAAFSTEQLETASNLRYSILVDNPQHCINFLEARGIHISDRWYRTPVDCGSTKCSTEYKKGSCPVAEKLSRSIVNLPTHQDITKQDIEFIVGQLAEYFQENPPKQKGRA